MTTTTARLYCSTKHHICRFVSIEWVVVIEMVMRDGIAGWILSAEVRRVAGLTLCFNSCQMSPTRWKSAKWTEIFNCLHNNNKCVNMEELFNNF